jgi:hypothetical protein
VFSYGFGDRQCQKLNGLDTPKSPSLLAAKGIAASPPLDEGDGRWSRATLRSTSWIAIMIKACMRRDVSKRAPG